MPQKQGNNTADGGRLSGANASAVAAANFAIGAGWGGTATFTVTSGSTDQVGQIVITASATTPAQATATVTLTFADGADASSPFGFVLLADNDQAVADNGATDIACTTTALSLTHSVLPLPTKTHTFSHMVVTVR